MVSHFSETMPKFEAIPVQHCHFKVPSLYKYCRSSDQMSGEPVNDDWLKGSRCHSYVQAKLRLGTRSGTYGVC